MDKGLKALAAIGLAVALAASPVAGREAGGSGVRPVAVRFVKSPFADYMFYLLFRSTGDFPGLEAAVPLKDVAPLEHSVSLAEQAASAQFTDYRQLYGLLPQYRRAKDRVLAIGAGPSRRYRILSYGDELPSEAQIETALRKGEAAYPRFAAFWTAAIAPKEDAQIAAWREQLAQCRPLDRLQQITRLSFPFAKLDVGAIALHWSGSGETDPAGVYTSLFEKPNLAWVLGHEGTHLTVDRYAGHDWYAVPQAQAAIDAVKARGGAAGDIEESLALFMQVKLSQACGASKPDRRMSSDFKAGTVKGEILRALEGGWDGYLADPRKNIMDYLVESTLKAAPMIAAKAS